jgi:chromosome segregation ATPase
LKEIPRHIAGVVQIETVQQDLHASVKLRQCNDAQLCSAHTRAEKAEAHLAQVHQGGVDMNLQIIKLQAECAQLRQDNDAMRAQQLSSAQESQEQQDASAKLKAQCSEQEAKIKVLDGQLQRLETLNGQLQEQSDKDRASAVQANDMSANLDRMYKSLQKQTQDDKSYAEVRHYSWCVWLQARSNARDFDRCKLQYCCLCQCWQLCCGPGNRGAACRVQHALTVHAR